MKHLCEGKDCDVLVTGQARYCEKHYLRVQRHGDPEIVLRDYSNRVYGSEEDRFWPKVTKTETCWLWTGYLQRGYGRFKLDGEGSILPHRWAYQQLVGPIPDGLTIDHLCRMRNCVNPDHMELVSSKTNVQRGAEHRAAAATTCKAGLHPYPESRMLEASTGRTRCLECKREASRRYKAKKRG